MCSSRFFFFNDTATTEISTLSLHDALPIFDRAEIGVALLGRQARRDHLGAAIERDVHQMRPFLQPEADRKSTRLNSSHTVISYAVFCLKKKKKTQVMNSSCALLQATRRSAY